MPKKISKCFWQNYFEKKNNFGLIKFFQISNDLAAKWQQTSI